MAATHGQTAPKQSYRWLRFVLPKKLQPALRGLRKTWKRRQLKIDEPYFTAYPYTQASMHRQKNLVRLARELETGGIEGVVVECGVLDGGTAALMACSTAESGRAVHLFDAWQGLPEAVKEDGKDAEKWVGQVVGSPVRVQRIFSKLSVDPSRVHIHRGWFNETFDGAEIDKIALFHIDCDFYEPTVLCLEHWYDTLVPGGYIQFDDYLSFEGCTRAVDEFLNVHPELELKSFGPQGQGEAFYLRKPLG